LDAEWRQELGEQLVRAAITVFDRHHAITRPQQSEKRRADRRHPRGETGRRLGAFEITNLFLEGAHGWVGVARVDMALLPAQRHGMPGIDIGVTERHTVTYRNFRRALIGFVRVLPRPDRQRRLSGTRTTLACPLHATPPRCELRPSMMQRLGQFTA